ncbi:hypothetical protein [Neptunicoccus sediminis]|uniref:hypothetical protein n=1 Tax=Neptunicoccus sediminis TaxID=1892596 RepID=UPI000845DC87|nr:hypothetical protein [Neptunicoccus sediminis]
MAKVTIHVGSHKTGTTLLQSVLANNRAALEERGVYYPETYRFMGDKRSTAISTNAQFEVPKALGVYGTQEREDLARFRAHLLEVAPNYSQIILSAETFYRMLPSKANLNAKEAEIAANTRGLRSVVFERLAEFLDGFDAEILVYFRRPDSFAESMYTEGIVNGKSTRSFDEFQNFQKFRFDYGAQIATFKQFFPVRSYVYEDKSQGGLIDNMFADLGIGPVFAQDTAMARRSVPKPAALWLRRCKLAPKITKRGFNQRKLFAYLPEHRGYFGGEERYGFWPSIAERDAFTAKALRNAPALSFPPAPRDLPQQCEWSQKDHKTAEAAFREWRAQQRDWIKDRRKNRIKPFMIEQGPLD